MIDLVVQRDDAVGRDTCVQQPQSSRELARMKGNAVEGGRRSEPADQRRQQHQSKLVNEPRTQQRAVQAASGFGDNARRSQLILHRAQGAAQVDLSITSDDSAVDDREPPPVGLGGQEVVIERRDAAAGRGQACDRPVRTRHEGSASLQNYLRRVPPLDLRAACCEHLVCAAGMNGVPHFSRGFVQQPARAVERHPPIS